MPARIGNFQKIGFFEVRTKFLIETAVNSDSRTEYLLLTVIVSITTRNHYGLTIQQVSVCRDTRTYACTCTRTRVRLCQCTSRSISLCVLSRRGETKNNFRGKWNDRDRSRSENSARQWHGPASSPRRATSSMHDGEILPPARLAVKNRGKSTDEKESSTTVI